MKIVIPTDSYLPRWDGIARVMSEIIPLMSKKHEIEIIVPDLEKIPKYKNVKVHRIPFSKIRLGDFLITKFKYKKIKSILRKSDVVFTQTTAPIGFCAIMAAKSLGKPSVAFIHNIESELFLKALPHSSLKKLFYPLVKMLFRFLYNKCDLLLVPSDGTADTLSWQRIKTEKKIIHLGVDTKKFIANKKEEAKKLIGVDSSDIIIGYHGRLGREKDLKTLLRAFNRLRVEDKNVKLMIIGEGIKKIEELFKNKPNIIFTGTQDNIVPYVQAMDIYVLPSLTETTSLTTLEAMACQVPVIVTKVGYLGDYIKNKENGLFFEKQNAYDLKKKIEFLIKNPAERIRLGKNGRKTVEEDFDWNVTANNMIKAIEDLVKKKEKKKS